MRQIHKTKINSRNASPKRDKNGLRALNEQKLCRKKIIIIHVNQENNFAECKMA